MPETARRPSRNIPFEIIEQALERGLGHIGDGDGELPLEEPPALVSGPDPDRVAGSWSRSRRPRSCAVVPAAVMLNAPLLVVAGARDQGEGVGVTRGVDCREVADGGVGRLVLRDHVRC